MLDLIEDLKTGKAILGLIENPKRTDLIFELSRLGRESKHVARIEPILAEARRNTRFVRLFEERYVPAAPDLSKLRALPEGTLGRAFVEHLERNGLKADFYPWNEPETLLDYLTLRVNQLHDVWHVLTGYGTDTRGELALQAFCLAQLKSGLSAVIVAGGILHLCRYFPEEVDATMAACAEGHLRGSRAPYLLSVKWEDLWDRGLEELRREYQLA